MQSKIRRCGQCAFWMNHHVCEYEKWKEGRWYGPSMKDIACDKFETIEQVKEDLAKLEVSE